MRYNAIRHYRNFSLIQLTQKLISLTLVWAIAFTSLPVYGSASIGTSADEGRHGQFIQGLGPDSKQFSTVAPGVLKPLVHGEAIHDAIRFAPAATEPGSLAATAFFPVVGHTTALLQAVTNAAILPILECVLNNGGGSYTARFGYNNLNTVTINIPVGDNNKFNPNSSQRGQTTSFLPGRQAFVFDVPFNGSNLIWSLKGPDGTLRNVTASSASPSCTGNHPPIANAGPGQTVFVGTPVQLDGSGSTDADGDPLTYLWNIASLPVGSTATLIGATSVHPTFVVDKPGSYTINLVVNDGKVNSTLSTVTISTKNSSPVAKAGSNQTITTTGTTVQLNGSASTDVDGDPLTYLWSLTPPPGSAAALSSFSVVNPTFVADKKGTYFVQLIVNDGKLNSDPASVTISDVNSPPVANPGPAQTVATRSLVQLDGSASTDVDGDPLTYSWHILSRPTGSAATLSDLSAVRPTFTVDVIGPYVIELVVNDGTTPSEAKTVQINDVNSAPVANAGPDQSVTVGSVVNLNGAQSSDVDGQTLFYSWSILNQPLGSTATLSDANAATPSFIADKAGEYVIQLQVNDGFLASPPSTVRISTINSVPVANPGADQTVTAGATVLLDGSGSSDADGDLLTYKWAILSQPTGSTTTLSDTTIVNPTFVPVISGLYVVQLIVNDGKVDSLPKTVTITVNPRNQAPVVNAGAQQVVALPNTTATLNGSVSDDGLPLGGTLTSLWTQVSGPAATINSPLTPITTVNLTTIGTYVFRLTANDSQLSSSADVNVILTPKNQPPVVNAGNPQTITLPASALLAGTVSDDGLPFGVALVTTWSEVAGPGTVTFSNASSTSTQASFSAPGSYVLRLSANDSQFTISSDVVITVNPAPAQDAPPIVSAGPNQTATFPASVTLTGSATSANPLTVSWSKVDGPGTGTFTNASALVTAASFTSSSRLRKRLNTAGPYKRR